MELKLKGKFSYINKYNKLIFVFNDDKTRAKLNRLTGEKVPYNDEDFQVTIKGSKDIPADIEAKVGLDCIVWVKPSYYNFTSKFEKNKGEKISGFNLILGNIKLDPKYEPRF